MQDHGDTQDPQVGRPGDPVEQTTDQAALAGEDSRRSGAAERASSARERAALAKQREVAAHARAIQLHERAADLQERLGYPDRAARAREHAEHARQLHELAVAEQGEQDRSRCFEPATCWPGRDAERPPAD